jgi:membrane-associated phospholipid phosphatase
MKFLISLLIGLSFSIPVLAFEDPTEGKPFFPWLWEDQFKPTIVNSFDTMGMGIFAVGATATVAARQYDETVFQHNQNEGDRIIDHDTADFGGLVGGGGPGVATAIAQLFFDQQNGLQHSRAIALTAVSHITLAGLIQRNRPSGRNYLSFPSGHASSSFATASSLAYSYGWKVGVPAYAAASFVAISRVNENIHWLSDVVAGAALGIYWGHASAKINPNNKKSDLTIMPIPTEDGAMISMQMSW